MNFSETFSGFPAPPSTGAWYYSYPQRLWRVDHNAPQSNNFCACALNTTDSCSLLFTPKNYFGLRGGMYIDFPAHPSQCCRACGADEGCTILKPDWLLSNASFAGVTEDGCSEFCTPGAEAAADCMSYPPSGLNPPCKYLETFQFRSAHPAATISHNLSFVAASYAEGPVDPTRFAVRSECEQPCPSLFPTTCG